MSQEEYVALKKKQKEKNHLKAAEPAYTHKYAPDTHVDELGTEALEGEGGWMREGEWVPSWGIVEFVSIFFGLCLTALVTDDVASICVQ
jgi:hypothetical protein